MSMINRENDSKNIFELHNQIEKLKEELKRKEIDIDDKIQNVKKMERYQTKLKIQYKQADEERNRLKSWYKPKLLETRKYQKELADELERIR